MLKKNPLSYKCLGHISKKTVVRLTKVNILPSLNFDDLGTCVDCTREFFSKTSKMGEPRSFELLEIVHTNISSQTNPFVCGKKYFITIINMLFRCGNIYLLKRNPKLLINFKVEIDKQLRIMINIKRSDIGGEYYGKDGIIGQHMGTFTLYLQDYGIAPQYTILYLELLNKMVWPKGVIGRLKIW